MFLYYDKLYNVVFVLGTLLFLLYKVYNLPYPSAVWELEFITLIGFALITSVRLEAGMRGNKTETSNTMALFLVFILFAAFCNVFFLQLQTYM